MKKEKRISIFLVDDDPVFLKSLEYYLKQKIDAKITAFATGEDCLNNLNPPPSIIILDYFLNSENDAAMNGIQVLVKIKLLLPEIVVIMLSAQDKVEVATNTIRYGAFDYVIKNENAHLRTQNAIKNAIENIELTNAAKSDKMKITLFAVGAFTIVLIVLLINKFILS